MRFVALALSRLGGRFDKHGFLLQHYLHKTLLQTLTIFSDVELDSCLEFRNQTKSGLVSSRARVLVPLSVSVRSRRHDGGDHSNCWIKVDGGLVDMMTRVPNQAKYRNRMMVLLQLKWRKH